MCLLITLLHSWFCFVIKWNLSSLAGNGEWFIWMPVNSELLVLDLKSVNPFFCMLFHSQQVLHLSILSDLTLFYFLFPWRKSHQDFWVGFFSFLHCMTHKIKKAAWNLGGYHLSKHRKITFFKCLTVKLVISKTWDGPGVTIALWPGCKVDILENAFCLYVTEQMERSSLL